MLVYTDKTKAMLIATYQKRLHLHNDILHSTYNNDALNSVDNDNVTGSVHINFTAKKISSNLWLLSKLKDYLSTEHRVQLNKIYIQPHIDYCSIVWKGHLNII